MRGSVPQVLSAEAKLHEELTKARHEFWGGGACFSLVVEPRNFVCLSSGEGGSRSGGHGRVRRAPENSLASQFANPSTGFNYTPHNNWTCDSHIHQYKSCFRYIRGYTARTLNHSRGGMRRYAQP